MSTPISSDQTIYHALAGSIAKNASRKALTYGDVTLTYAAVGARVERLARGLRRLGVGPGDKVAFLLPSCLEAPIVFFAPSALGAVIVPINPVFRQKEIQHILLDSEASVVIADPRPLGNDLRGILERTRSSLPYLKHIVWRGPIEQGLLSLNDLAVDADPLPPRPVPPDSLCALVYTSGTTGVPKAVMHSHSSMIGAVSSQQSSGEAAIFQLWHMLQLVRTYGIRFLGLASGKITTLSLAPMHSLVGYGATLYGLLEGHHVVIADRFHPARILELVEQRRINAFHLTPTMLAAVLDSPDLQKRDLSSLYLMYVGAAPVAPELVKRARKLLKCPVLISFGMTELGGGVMMSTFSDPINLQGETVGKLLPGVQAKIVDEHNDQVGQGQIGELVLRMQNPMLGYYKAPELTAASLAADGWYYTGDLATCDVHGYYRIVGRKKEMIIRGGQNIYPTEIENHLMGKPDIQNVAVVGVPDPVVGERVWAYVLPHLGARVTVGQVMAYIRGELAPYKAPDQVRIVEDLPLTTTGKVQKYLLKELARQESASPQG